MKTSSQGFNLHFHMKGLPRSQQWEPYSRISSYIDLSLITFIFLFFLFRFPLNPWWLDAQAKKETDEAADSEFNPRSDKNVLNLFWTRQVALNIDITRFWYQTHRVFDVPPWTVLELTESLDVFQFIFKIGMHYLWIALFCKTCRRCPINKQKI